MNELKIIDSFDQFLKLQQPWGELLSNTEIDHIYMKHEWFNEWIEAYAIGDSLAIVTLWSDGLLAGAAPLYRRQFNFRGVKAKGLSFMSSGISPRCNFIVAADNYLEELLGQVLMLKNWDVLFTENMEEQVGVTKRYVDLLNSSKKKFSFEVEEGRHSPYMTIEGSWENYWETLSSKKRNNFKSMVKKLEKFSPLEVTPIVTGEQFGEMLPQILEVSRKSWKGLQGDQMSPDSPEGKMFIGFMPIALEHNWVSLHALRLNHRMVAYDYILNCHERYVGSRSDYDKEYRAYSPGNFLKLWFVKNLYAKGGSSEFDWGGEPDLYKLVWCNHIRNHITVTVGNDNLKGRGILFAKNRLLPALRKIIASPKASENAPSL